MKVWVFCCQVAAARKLKRPKQEMIFSEELPASKPTLCHTPRRKFNQRLQVLKDVVSNPMVLIGGMMNSASRCFHFKQSVLLLVYGNMNKHPPV